jgi:hypothetical protein
MGSLTSSEPRQDPHQLSPRSYNLWVVRQRAEVQRQVGLCGIQELVQALIPVKTTRGRQRQATAVTSPRRSSRQAALEPVNYTEVSLAEHESFLSKMSADIPQTVSKTPARELPPKNSLLGFMKSEPTSKVLGSPLIHQIVKVLEEQG